MESRGRLIQAKIAAPLLATRGFRALGFVRLGDYTRERLGVSPRTIEEDARVAVALDDLPKLAAAFLAGAITWTHLRLLTGIATSADEAQWLRHALSMTTRDLEALVHLRRVQMRAPFASRETDARGPIDANRPSDETGIAKAPNGVQSEGAEPGRRWTMRLSRTGRRLWRQARELAERLAGSRLSEAQVLELIAAETMAGPNACASPDGPVETPAESPPPGEAAILAFLASHGCAEGFPWLAAAERDSSGSSSMDSLLDGLADADAFELDRRLCEIRCALQRLDFDLGVGLRALVDSRAYRDLGFATFRLYVAARLGICASKASSLLSLERRSGRGASALRGAYRDGAVTLMAAHTILPLMGGDHDSDWIARASAVTLRRLEDEVTWALTRIDVGPDRRCPAPPPIDLDVRAETFASLRREEVLMRAHGPAAEETQGTTTEDSAPTPGSADDDKVQMRAQDAGQETQGTTTDDSAPTPGSADDDKVQMRAQDTAEEAQGSTRDAAAPAPGSVDDDKVRMRAQDASATEGEGSAAAEPSGDDDIQRHARDSAATGGQGDRPEVELAFWVPDSIAALAEEAMLAVRQGCEPRWRAFERMVALVILEWLSVPRHRDPIFERDGWRCSVPACTSRRHLHDHHRRFRSLGGGNEPANRTSVCAAHHLHGIHAGNIHARGTAPDGITWELGCRPGHQPLIRTLGDYNLSPVDQDAGSHDPGPRARDDGPRPRDPDPGPHDTDPCPHDGGPLLRDADPGSRDTELAPRDDSPAPCDQQSTSRRHDPDPTSGHEALSPRDHQNPDHRHDPGLTSSDDAPVPRHLDPINPARQPA